MLSASATSVSPTNPLGSAASAKAEFFICLARAFQPPRTPEVAAAFADALASDLGELAAAAGYAIGTELRRFAVLAADPGGHLLQEYSALFLVPPVPATLNTGLYLDGALLGRTTQAMLERYREGGLAPDERYRDLPDHVTMQLEFVAVQFARAAEGDPSAESRARGFLAAFVLAWLPGLAQALDAAAARLSSAHLYRALAAILEAAARQEVALFPDAG